MQVLSSVLRPGENTPAGEPKLDFDEHRSDALPPMVHRNPSRSFVAAAVAVFAALASLALPAEAQWKWRDGSGRVQYSDLPPPQAVPEQDILSRPASQRRSAPIASPVAAIAASASAAASAASSALAPRTTDPELEAKRKMAEADEAAKVKAEQVRIAAAKADNCSRARTQLRTLDSGIRLARANEKGEREVLDDKQRADEARRAQDVVAADCR